MSIGKLVGAGVCALVIAAACGGATNQSGSNSNWSSVCTANSDCGGSLECQCGACTAKCTTARDCSGFTNGAICASSVVAGQGCATPPTEATCVPVCTKNTDCTMFGADAVCFEGTCRRPMLLSDGGFLGCDVTPNETTDRIFPITDAADKSCRVDADCTLSPTVRCGDPCGLPVISKTGAAAIASAVAAIDVALCDPYEAAGCPPPLYVCPAIGVPRCVAHVCQNSVGLPPPDGGSALDGG